MIETDRLILRPWRKDDAGALFKYASDARVSELALWPRHTSVDMSRAVIADIFIPNACSFAVVLKETGEPVGCIGLVPEGEGHYPAASSEREAGYWIGRPYWGHGLATEALHALIGYCRDLLGLDGLLITTDSRNIASQRVALKCGFRFVADYVYDGIPSKVYRLELLPDHCSFRDDAGDEHVQLGLDSCGD
ncbi:GNAT family N-acetyltransferase [uncultured Muribaculum sp.]|uniref:GNAT family N-acetyltransferase n=1 Tax=uncultured Muribaculum sp. TaxID=1918613 RepID=UPI0026004B35|nr:GNAT family N-acetyltransferase [uncultured Muribaculum sp.]